MTGPAQPGLSRHPGLTGGAKLQGSLVSVDQVTVTGPVWAREEVSAIVGALFGEVTKRGATRFEPEAEWRGSVVVGWREGGVGGGYVKVEVPSAGWAGLLLSERVEFLAGLLGLGCSCTRLDVAVDISWCGSQAIFDEVFAACVRGCLVGSRSFARDDRFRNGLMGRTVYLGVRGDGGSGVFVRLYDKGVQTGQDEPGCWLRWEVEFGGKRAAVVGRQVVAAPEVCGELFALAFGAVDFREPGGSSRSLERRARCAWWGDFSGGAGRRVAAPGRSSPTWESRRAWLERSVLPSMLGMAGVAEQSVGEFVESLVVSGRVIGKVVGGELASELRAEVGCLRSDPFSFGVPPFKKGSARA